MKYLIVLLSVLILTSCGGGSANVQPEAPSITSKSVSGNSLVYYYSDGSSISKTISSYTDTWATDHVTRTRNYILADNSTEYIQETITPTNSTSKTTSEKTTTTTYGDGHVDTITSPATSGRTATTDNITGITQWTNYLDGDWRQKFYAFTWSNYANFGDLPNHDNHGIGFNTLGSSRQLTQISGQGWVETHDGGFPSDNNIFLTYDPTTSDISFLSVRPETSSISISNWNKTRVNATSSVFGEFDFLEYSDIKFLFHNSYKHRYEHLVFGAWAEVNDGSTAEYGAFFGPKRTRMVSAVIPASGSYSFVGKMVGAFDSSIY